MAITYQLAARPPQIVLIPAEELPDLVFLAEHPQEEAPPELVQEGQELRRRFIQDQISRTPRGA